MKAKWLGKKLLFGAVAAAALIGAVACGGAAPAAAPAGSGGSAGSGSTTSAGSGSGSSGGTGSTGDDGTGTEDICAGASPGTKRRHDDGRHADGQAAHCSNAHRCAEWPSSLLFRKRGRLRGDHLYGGHH